jgi:hypothetical protein
LPSINRTRGPDALFVAISHLNSIELGDPAGVRAEVGRVERILNTVGLEALDAAMQALPQLAIAFDRAADAFAFSDPVFAQAVASRIQETRLLVEAAATEVLNLDALMQADPSLRITNDNAPQLLIAEPVYRRAAIDTIAQVRTLSGQLSEKTNAPVKKLRFGFIDAIGLTPTAISSGPYEGPAASSAPIPRGSVDPAHVVRVIDEARIEAHQFSVSRTKRANKALRRVAPEALVEAVTKWPYLSAVLHKAVNNPATGTDAENAAELVFAGLPQVRAAVENVYQNVLRARSVVADVQSRLMPAGDGWSANVLNSLLPFTSEDRELMVSALQRPDVAAFVENDMHSFQARRSVARALELSAEEFRATGSDDLIIRAQMHTPLELLTNTEDIDGYRGEVLLIALPYPPEDPNHIINIMRLPLESLNGPDVPLPPTR